MILKKLYADGCISCRHWGDVFAGSAWLLTDEHRLPSTALLSDGVDVDSAKSVRDLRL